MDERRILSRPAPVHLVRVILLCFLFACEARGNAPADSTVRFESSNLPIVVINTKGQSIPDEPKIDARMGIIDNGEGVRHYLADPFNAYDGRIGIELRGSSSQTFPKKQYAVETRDSLGDDLKVALLGLPEESDWVLTDEPFDVSRFARRRVEDAVGRKLFVSSPEDTILAKLRLACLSGGSEKQFQDALRVYEVQHASLEVDYLERRVHMPGLSECRTRIVREAAP